jgi:chromosome segregation ATPase
LNNICFNSTKSRILSLDYSRWDSLYLKNLSNWFHKAVELTNDQEIIEAYQNFKIKYALDIKGDIQSAGTPAKDIIIQQKDTTETKRNLIEQGISNAGESQYDDGNKVEQKDDSKERIIRLAYELQLEAIRAVKEKHDLLDKINNLNNILSLKGEEIQRLQERILELRKENENLKEDIRIHESVLKTKDEKIADLDERLRFLYTVERNSMNQELSALKNNLSQQLKLDYETYKVLASKEPDQYSMYYEGLLGVIENIFDALHRKGIVIQNENE